MSETSGNPQNQVADWLRDAFEQEKKRRAKVDAFVSAAEPLIETVKQRCGDLISLFNTEFPSELDNLRAALDSLSFRLERPSSRGDLITEIWAAPNRRGIFFRIPDDERVYELSVTSPESGPLQVAGGSTAVDHLVRMMMGPLLFPEQRLPAHPKVLNRITVRQPMH